MKALWDELRLVYKLSFVDALAAIRSGALHHPGFLSDVHLRKGFIFAGPLFLGAALYILFFAYPRIALQPAFLAVFLISIALLTNLLWLGIAATSRARFNRERVRKKP